MTRRPSKKFDARYLGPFKISKRIGKLAYRLELPPSMARLHPVFNVSLLEPWREPPPEAGFRPSNIQIPDDMATGDQYEVKAILNSNDTKARGREYLVKWLGWPAEDATWEPAKHLDHCSELLAEFWDNEKTRTHQTTRGQSSKRRWSSGAPTKASKKRGRGRPRRHE
jgi:hypothetical protein